jgi:hypothetical protein
MPTYIITTRTFGELRKADDNIKSARRWSAKAFDQGEVLGVTRETKLRAVCDRCGWSPCECRWRRRQAAVRAAVS